MQLLLLSNSSCYGQGYLEHAESEVREFFSGIGRILFVPFALDDQAGYWKTARERFARLGIEVDRLEEGTSALDKIGKAAAIFVGGGNTFRLLDRLQRSGALEAIRGRVIAGMPYIGSSAGTVVSGPTIKTTNDMPIVQPGSFEALNLVPFQINCHYIDADPESLHMGETRERRLVEFLEENDALVIGLREGAWLRVDRDDQEPLRVTLRGATGARIFRRGGDPTEHHEGADLSALLTSG